MLLPLRLSTSLVSAVIALLAASAPSNAQGVFYSPPNCAPCEDCRDVQYKNRKLFTKSRSDPHDGSRVTFTDSETGDYQKANWFVEAIKTQNGANVLNIATQNGAKDSTGLVFDITYADKRTRYNTAFVFKKYLPKFASMQKTACKASIPEGMDVLDVETVAAYYNDEDPSFIS
ncbi:hypothetical protein CBS101457_005567 [Exobasidium rhododendri]|nr:hypothetical protein CBS101457_005567 [Exobasidium rhododendri]